MHLADVLDRYEIRLGAEIFLPVDPATGFGYYADAEGEPHRVRTQDRALVPVFPWRSLGLDEKSVMIRVLNEAASANPFKLGKLSDAKPRFWDAYRAVLRHPNTGVIQTAIPQIVSEEVPQDRVVVLTGGVKPLYVMQGNRRNIFVWNRMSLLSVQMAT